jgi:hypothetical protein
MEGLRGTCRKELLFKYHGMAWDGERSPVFNMEGLEQRSTNPSLNEKLSGQHEAKDPEIV